MTLKNKLSVKIAYLIVLFAVFICTMFVLKNNEKQNQNSTDTTCNIIFDAPSIFVSDPSMAMVDGNRVIIGKEGQYHITGYSSDGQIFVDTKDLGKIKLCLDNLELHSIDSAPVSVISGGDVELFVTGINTLKDSDKRADNDEANGCLYSKKDVSITGDGELNVIGSFHHGISVRADLEINSGIVNVEAVKNAIDVKNNANISGGKIGLTALGDGINAKNSNDNKKGVVIISGGIININAEDEGIQAASDITITGGEIAIESTGMIIKAGGIKNIDNSCVYAVDKGER